MKETWTRSALLLGEGAIDRLCGATVAIFGLGGVGSYALEGLARGGVGRFVLVDSDDIAPSNINRQLLALHSTVGMSKVEAARQRVLSINPDAQVTCHKEFYTVGNHLIEGVDFVLDCIDTVSAKLNLICACKVAGVQIISAMGAGDKLNPALFEVSDIYKTSVCPLCRVMRKELKRREVDSLRVVYSKEEPMTHFDVQCCDISPTRRHTPGSLPFVPPVMGLIMAGEVVKELIK